jgi:hypothetical protein
MSPKRILDVGVGSGFYGRTLRLAFPNAYISGIEIWPAYITDHLKFYDEILLGDAMTVNLPGMFPFRDLVIAADVIEHFTKPDAIKLVNKLKAITETLIITMPITYCPQGAYQGNEHEAHLYQWTASEVEADLGMKLLKDCGICGLFVFKWG